MNTPDEKEMLIILAAVFLHGRISNPAPSGASMPDQVARAINVAEELIKQVKDK